jgi:hypothetical protein
MALNRASTSSLAATSIINSLAAFLNRSHYAQVFSTHVHHSSMHAGKLFTTPKVNVIEYPPLDWATNMQLFAEIGCVGKLPESCTELIALGCDEIRGPRFHLGGLQPPYAVMECIHGSDEPPDREYFRQPPGLDTRYRSYVIFQDGKYRLIIDKSEFKDIFAPVESTDEALSYAMAMTSLEARFDIDPNANIDYLVDMIEETHAEETLMATLFTCLIGIIKWAVIFTHPMQ